MLWYAILRMVCTLMLNKFKYQGSQTASIGSAGALFYASISILPPDLKRK